MTKGKRIGLGVAVAVCLAAPSQAAGQGAVAPGPFGVERVTYDAGALPLSIPQQDDVDPDFEQPLVGSVTFPSGSDGPWPVALFLHGRHATCIDADGAEYVPDPATQDVACRDPIPNYAGYDYISNHLASHGYATIAPSANAIHSYDGGAPDGGAAARAEVIEATLDLVAAWSRGAGPGAVRDSLSGRLDLAAITLMGHSRGGEGVTEFIARNARRPQPYSLGGVLALAPTDAARGNPFRAGGATNLAELLPGCDGDVVDLEGGRVFERVKYDPDGAPFEKLQWLVEGTNHNWFNTVWRADDSRGMVPPLAEDSACNPRSTSSTRLDRGQQRAAGIALVGGFVRRFSGGEIGLDPVLHGDRWPRAACRTDGPLPCRVARSTSRFGPASARETLIRPGARRPAAVNAVGARIASHGLALDWCDPTGPGVKQARRCPGPPEQSKRLLFVNRSEAPQLVVTWNRRSTVETDLGPAGDASGYSELALRVVPTLSGRNPRARGNRVMRATQRFDLVLTDARGERARVPAERFSPALAPSAGDSFRNLILSELRVPLRRFDGVDLSDLRTLELRFGVRGRRSGQLQIADVAFEGPASSSSPSPAGWRPARSR